MSHDQFKLSLFLSIKSTRDQLIYIFYACIISVNPNCHFFLVANAKFDRIVRENRPEMRVFSFDFFGWFCWCFQGRIPEMQIDFPKNWSVCIGWFDFSGISLSFIGSFFFFFFFTALVRCLKSSHLCLRDTLIVVKNILFIT